MSSLDQDIWKDNWIELNFILKYNKKKKEENTNLKFVHIFTPNLARPKHARLRYLINIL